MSAGSSGRLQPVNLRVCVCVCLSVCVCRFADRGSVRLGALAGQSAEDAPLGHLQAGGDGRDSGQRGR